MSCHINIIVYAWATREITESILDSSKYEQYQSKRANEDIPTKTSLGTEIDIKNPLIEWYIPDRFHRRRDVEVREILLALPIWTSRVQRQHREVSSGAPPDA